MITNGPEGPVSPVGTGSITVDPVMAVAVRCGWCRFGPDWAWDPRHPFGIRPIGPDGSGDARSPHPSSVAGQVRGAVAKNDRVASPSGRVSAAPNGVSS